MIPIQFMERPVHFSTFCPDRCDLGQFYHKIHSRYIHVCGNFCNKGTGNFYSSCSTDTDRNDKSDSKRMDNSDNLSNNGMERYDKSSNSDTEMNDKSDNNDTDLYGKPYSSLVFPA
jgi:hypothetical protein